MSTKRQHLTIAVAMLLVGIAGAQQPGDTASEDDEASGYFVLRNEVTVHSTPDLVSRVMLTADRTNGRYTIVDEVFKREMRVPPHKHSYHSETFVILAGRMEWTVGGERKVVGKGDLVYIPPDTPHAAKVSGDEDVHAIMIYEPGGYEFNLQRRLSMTDEQRGDPETVERMMELNDVIPVPPVDQESALENRTNP